MRWLALALFLLPSFVYSKAMMSVTEGNVTVTLYDEPCRLMNLVTNLPGRATWTENGKTSEACFGTSDGQTLLLYFEIDKTVGLIPTHAFKRVNTV